MRQTSVFRYALLAIVAATLFLAACNKKQAKAVPPTPPPAPTPTASLTASPADIQQGQNAQLSWSTTNATSITITGLGTVSASGTRSVSPSNSTTYELVAKGPGGSADSSARVTVTPAPAMQSGMSEDMLFQQNVKDVFFDYDKYSIRPDQVSVLEKDANFLSQHPGIGLTVAGHCDDRGSEEYNLALGASRANSFKEELVKRGISADRIKTTSLGKEQPFCNDENEQCWQLNRRDHLAKN
ncbi:MAG TPA: OmpA family protein [Terriglobales bacterium]|nr:OmpA family protein [Terriglobales bacterium]